MTGRAGRYDLHMHSTHSDGTAAVRELAERVVRAGLCGFSLTDHDTTAGQQEAAAAAAELGLEYVTGIELSLADGDRDIHLLVYGYEPDDGALQERLEAFRQARRARAAAMAARLKQLGVEIDVEALLAHAPHGSLGRPHLARALVEAGAVGSVREAFARYLAAGRPAYLPKFKLGPADGIALALRAGGVPVLAHPASYPFEPDLDGLVAVGLKGLETSYPKLDPETEAYWRVRARRHRLLETGGSDFHGAHRRGVDVGEATIPERAFRRLLTACR